MNKVDYTTLPGDPAQQARRASMFDPYEKPEYWLNLSERGFIHAMRRTGNTPDIELSNVVDHLVKAAEFGADQNGGFLSEQLAKRIAAEPEPLASV